MSIYKFEFVGGSENVYYFVTELLITYKIRFKPMPYLFGTAWAFHDDVVELTIDVADNPTGVTRKRLFLPGEMRCWR